VQLARKRDAKDDPDRFWKWLWWYERPQPRLAATHGIKRENDPDTPLAGNARLHMVETSGKFAWTRGDSAGGGHFGIPIALGGDGTRSPYSGATISANGANGHLYLYYLAPTDTQYGGILIGCESSNPPDLPGEHADHYGGGHSIFGGANKYSCTGGL